MASEPPPPIDLRAQTIENCKFFSTPYSHITVVIARDALGTSFKAIVVKTEGGERQPVLSETGPSVHDALQALHVKSAEAVQNYITSNGFALVARAKNRKSLFKGVLDDVDDSDTASSTVTLDECESLSDDETVSVTSAGRAKTRSRRRKASTRQGRAEARSPAASTHRAHSISSSSSDSEPHYDPPSIPSRRPPFLANIAQCMPPRPPQPQGSLAPFLKGVPLPRAPPLPRPGAPGRLSPAGYGSGVSLPAATGPVSASPQLPLRPASAVPLSSTTFTPTGPAATTTTSTAAQPPSIVPTPPSTHTPNGTAVFYPNNNNNITNITPNNNHNKTVPLTHDIILHIRPRQSSPSPPGLVTGSCPAECRALERIIGPVTLRAVKNAALACARRAAAVQQQQQQPAQAMTVMTRPGGGGVGNGGGGMTPWQQGLSQIPVMAVIKAVVVDGVSYDLSGWAAAHGGGRPGLVGVGVDDRDLGGLLRAMGYSSSSTGLGGHGGVGVPPRFEVEVGYAKGPRIVGYGDPVVVAPAGGCGGGVGGSSEPCVGATVASESGGAAGGEWCSL